MKKILLTTVIAIASVFIGVNANAQSFRVHVNLAPQRQSFYYYPRANVYYNIVSRQYMYSRNGVWFSANTAPFRFAFNEPRFTVYHYGQDVWRDNRSHVIAYRQYRQPEIVYQQPYYHNDNCGNRDGYYDRDENGRDDNDRR